MQSPLIRIVSVYGESCSRDFLFLKRVADFGKPNSITGGYILEKMINERANYKSTVVLPLTKCSGSENSRIVRML